MGKKAWPCCSEALRNDGGAVAGGHSATLFKSVFGNSLKITKLIKATDKTCKRYLNNAILTNVVNEAMDYIICAKPIDGTTCSVRTKYKIDPIFLEAS